MRVLVSPDCFTGTLTSVEAATAIREGWLTEHPEDEVVIAPLSDGGPGSMIEVGPTSEIFSRPRDTRTENYVTGRFG